MYEAHHDEEYPEFDVKPGFPPQPALYVPPSPFVCGRET
jgi:hypothetical protein